MFCGYVWGGAVLTDAAGSIQLKVATFHEQIMLGNIRTATEGSIGEWAS